MAQRTPLSLRSTTQRKQMYRNFLWKVTRTDGTVFYFTDHNRDIDFDGQTWEPAGGLSPSATQHRDELRETNKEYNGVVLDHDKITFDDLRGGLYRNATIEESMIDWRNPTAGQLYTTVYEIVEVEWDGDGFSAQVAGVTTRLRQEVGEAYSRMCRWPELGYNRGTGLAGCLVDTALMTVTGIAVTEIQTQRKSFVSDVTTVIDNLGVTQAHEANWFNSGILTWTSGNNTGQAVVIDRSLNDSSIELRVPLPYDIQVGDEFNAYPGCDRLLGTCRNKFDNADNFGGFPHIPGTDAMTYTPNAK